MITFKKYLIESLSSPLDLGIFHNVVKGVDELVGYYKSGKNLDWFEGDGSGFDFVINFKGTPFEKIGRRRLHIVFNDNFKYPQYFNKDQIMQLNINDLVDEQPHYVSLEHELVHFLQDLSKRYDIPWGTAPKQMAIQNVGTKIHSKKPSEYLSNLMDYFVGIRSVMKENGISKEEIVDYLLGKNDSMDDIGFMVVVKGRLSNMYKRYPEIAKRYIKKLYTSL